MDQERIGKFISKLRKEKNLTQEQFAEKLGVSSKSVSRWENGRNLPDLSLLIPISKELDITVNELLSGKIIEKEVYQKNLEENIIKSLVNLRKYFNLKVLRIISIFISIVCIGIILGIITFLLICNYLTHPVYLEQDNIEIEICDFNDRFYKVTITIKDKIGAHINLKPDFHEKTLNIRVYRSYLETKNTRLLDGYGLGNQLIEKDIETIYYDSNLIWNSGMEIKKCTE